LSAVAQRATASAEARRAKAEGGSDEAIQTSSFRGDAKHRTRNLEIPGLVLTYHPGMTGELITLTSDHLFVYGTLMRGFDHPMARLLSRSADFLGEAHCRAGFIG